MNPTRETWKPVAAWEGLYEVSDHGAVRSLDRTVMTKAGHLRTTRGRVLKPSRMASGHLQVSLYRGEERLCTTVHALVMAAFVGPRPAGMDICHKDSDPSNNHVSNLRYDTRRGNVEDTMAAGRISRGTARHNNTLTPEQVREIRAKYVPRVYTLKMLADEYGVTPTNIHAIVGPNSRSWNWLD